MRALGIDYGEARIGVAVSDEDRRLALPLCAVARAKSLRETAKAVAAAVAEHAIDTLVVGLPLRLDGTEGESARRARAAGAALGAALGVEAVYWDERLTTAEAERALKAQGLSGRARRRVVDQSAAAILLQSWLDSRTERTWEVEDIERLALGAPERERGHGRRRSKRPGR
jgi:putative Holliday junction resolvase